MKTNRSIPAATVIPELAYADVRTAARWLSAAFGFTEHLRIGEHRVQLVFGDGAVVAIEGPKDVADPPMSTHAMLVRVDDVDAHAERARRHGVAIIREAADYPYGERQYTARDCGGHVWTFSQSIADVDPAEWGGELLDGAD